MKGVSEQLNECMNESNATNYHSCPLQCKRGRVLAVSKTENVKKGAHEVHFNYTLRDCFLVSEDSRYLFILGK